MIPYSRQCLSEDDLCAVLEVLRSEYLTQGPMIASFEEVVARYCGVKHAVAVNSATSALHLACLALGLGPDEALWTSPNSFVASANCALYCGADVDFVDIDPRSYNMSVPALAEKLEQSQRTGSLPKIVLPVHYAGQSCEMSEIHELSSRYGFRIVEDASHALGAKYRDYPVGACRYSDISVLSFHPVKMITTGEGGMALTNDDNLANRMKEMRSHGVTRDPRRMDVRPEDEIWNYQQMSLGFNYRITDIQAALGVSQMSKLDSFVTTRRRICGRYDDAFRNLPLKTPWQHPDTRSSYHLYTIRVPGDGSVSQHEIYAAMRKAGIAANLHYVPIYRHPFYEQMGFKSGYCKQAELHHRESISLPVFPFLEQSEQDVVIEVVRELYKP